MTRLSILQTIYQCNSNINRITGQLKQINDNPKDYQTDIAILSESYANQLTAESEKLSRFSHALKVYNAE